MHSIKLLYKFEGKMSYLSHLDIDLNSPFLNEWLALILSSGLGLDGLECDTQTRPINKNLKILKPKLIEQRNKIWCIYHRWR